MVADLLVDYSLRIFSGCLSRNRPTCLLPSLFVIALLYLFCKHTKQKQKSKKMVQRNITGKGIRAYVCYLEIETVHTTFEVLQVQYLISIMDIISCNNIKNIFYYLFKNVLGNILISI